MAADAQGRFPGQNDLLYIADTTPTTPTDPNGADYELVGLLRENPLRLEANTIQARDKTSSDWTQSVIVSKGGTLTARVYAKAGTDGGQDQLFDSYNSKTAKYFLIHSLSGAKGFHGWLQVTGIERSSAADELVEITFTADVWDVTPFDIA